MDSKKNIIAIGFGCVLALLGGASMLHAQMSSSNYSITADSLNSGGILSSSPSYLLEDTVGEAGTGLSSSASFNLSAGYQAMTGSSISIAGVTDVVLSPTIDGFTGGTANGSTTATVRTDNAAGYSLSVRADSSPALASSGDSFADYTPAGADPDFDFTTGDGESFFGFSPQGVDVTDTYKDDGVSCNTGALNTAEKCWEGLSMSSQIVSRKTSGNSPGGSATTILFRAEAGASRGQDAGTYTATITLTALPL